MPIIASAAKALRHDRKRTQVNRRWRYRMKEALDLVEKEPSADHITAAYSILDRAVKHQLLHKNKAARLKSHLAKSLTAPVTTQPKPKTKASTKAKRKPKVKSISKKK